MGIERPSAGAGNSDDPPSRAAESGASGAQNGPEDGVQVVGQPDALGTPGTPQDASGDARLIELARALAGLSEADRERLLALLGK
jgi:hypothetical protein